MTVNMLSDGRFLSIDLGSNLGNDPGNDQCRPITADPDLLLDFQHPS